MVVGLLGQIVLFHVLKLKFVIIPCLLVEVHLVQVLHLNLVQVEDVV